MQYFTFENKYQRLPERFYQRVNPTPVAQPTCLIFNKELAQDLELPLLEDFQILTPFLAGNRLFDGSFPIALAYAGHQFGNFVPTLADGRAHLLGEHSLKNGKSFDVQLKGSGQTQFSRRGDGRSALGPALREYIISEALAHLKIPTTRTLAVVSTGESVFRPEETPGGLSVRIASSHIRIGTFEYFSCRNDIQAIKTLADFSINKHWPELLNAGANDSDNIYLRFFRNVMSGQVQLIVQWLSVGFIHGVMNTDNTSISGESIDFGPCAFLDVYKPDQVFSSIDRNGRYAYFNQPEIIKWNLARLAETLIPLVDEDSKQAIELLTAEIEGFDSLFNSAWLQQFSKKIGIINPDQNTWKIIEDFLEIIFEENRDFTQSFRQLPLLLEESADRIGIESTFQNKLKIQNWVNTWSKHLKEQKMTQAEAIQLMNQTNPNVIPRNHLVEKAIAEIVSQGKMDHLNSMMVALKDPFSSVQNGSEFCRPPTLPDPNYRTFCGT